MPVFHDDTDDEDDLFDQVNRMADRMGLQGEKRATYIDDHMLQGGYQRVQSRDSYAKVQDDQGDDQGSGNRWGFGGGRRRQESGRDSGSRRRDDHDSF